MDLEESFKRIQNDIKNEHYSDVRPQIDAIAAQCSDDADVLIKCASLLKTVDDEEGCQQIVVKVLADVPKDKEAAFSLGLAVRSLGDPVDAYGLMKPMRGDRAHDPEIARTLLDMDETEEALSIVQGLEGRSSAERLLLCDCLCAVAEFKDALSEAESLEKDENGSYESLVNLCSVMIRMGDNKGAIRLARSRLKEDRKSADSLALAAYVMRINGRLPAAANFANQALHVQYDHVGALETMAFCLIEKGRFRQAKLMAGVINDKHPGDPAAIRILNACTQAVNATGI
jgi:thioredoxin-like negative regulator of GroEL